MVLSEPKLREYETRMLQARLRVLNTHGFYGLLLMHMRFAIDRDCPTAATDGETIYFGPNFLERLSDPELDFVLMHEILHVALQHILRCGNRDHEKFNIACDIVVNSNILRSNHMRLSSISVGGKASMHLAPNGREGYEFTAEELYELLPAFGGRKAEKDFGSGKGTGSGSVENKGNVRGQAKGRAQQASEKPQPHSKASEVTLVDDHSKWGELEEDDRLRDAWLKRVHDAATAIEIRERMQSRGLIPLCARRLIGELRKPQTDWQTVLNGFIQEETNDYSFSPPDRRYGDGDFFLPDFNEKESAVKDILFMIDTSGSMSDAAITVCFSEVRGAMEQFGGKLRAWLGFFDAEIVEPVPMEEMEVPGIRRPYGGGGTDFQLIFEYVQQYMKDDPPAAIIILTDGYAPFPQEHLAMGIPVLWLLTDSEVDPPWGKTARVTVKR